MIQFRVYQLDLIGKIVTLINSKDQCKILTVLTMAGGKTFLMGGVIQALSLQYGSLKVVMVTPFAHLKKEAVDAFKMLDIPIEVSTYDEALSKGIRHVDILLIDEVHHIGAPKWGKVPYFVRSKAILGFTGTPFRLDHKPLLEENGGLFSDVLFGPTPEELTKLEYLANLNYLVSPLLKKTIEVPVGKFFTVGYITKTFYEIENKEPEIVDEYTSNFKDMQGIVFCKSEQHSKDIVDRFKAVGVSADYISCYRPLKENQKVKEEAKLGNIKILATVNMGSQGMDIPRLKLGIMAREIVNSVNLFCQQIGRILRPFNGEEAIILDLCGNAYRHGSINKIVKEKVIV